MQQQKTQSNMGWQCLFALAAGIAIGVSAKAFITVLKENKSNLEDKMWQAASEEDYEKAIAIRDKINPTFKQKNKIKNNPVK